MFYMKRINMLLIVVLITLFSYIGGLLSHIFSSDKVDPETKIKEYMLDLLAYPSAASFKNINYHYLRKDNRGREIGFYCGEVFGFENELPYGYKRFFVKSIKQPNGDVNISIPSAEKIENFLSQKEFDKLWENFCSK